MKSIAISIALAGIATAGISTAAQASTPIIKTPAVTGKSLAAAAAVLRKDGLRPHGTVPGAKSTAKVIKQFPHSGSSIRRGATVNLATARPVRPRPTFNQKVAAKVKTYEGVPYVWGGTTPHGFDCSGLTQYVYRQEGAGIPRTADEQFRHFAPESHQHAEPGDLVFFHDTSNLRSNVYHVGVYEGGSEMVAAPHTGTDVQEQSFTWGGDTVSFGTISHSPSK
jgi:peptidoglycan DL-endopeptidase CwlO